MPFVGREQELASLVQRLDGAGCGEGGVVLIAGEPGIGKTRLLHEFSDRARQAGWLILSGSAYDTEGMPPYLPFVEAIGHHVQSHSDEALLPIVEDAAPIAALIPVLRARFPDLPSPQPLPPEAERFRLFESVSEFFLRTARSSETRGVLLCLEDLHWADPSSLGLFLHLSRKVSDSRVLMVGTYRPEVACGTAPLLGVLAEMSRERLGDRLTLSRLSWQETEALVTALGGKKPAEAVTTAIQEQTEGNPFFVQELVRQLLDEGRDLSRADEVAAEWHLPGSIREAIGHNLSRLSGDTRRLLDAGAVLGNGFEFDVAAQMCGDPPDILIARVEEALAAAIIVEEAQGFRFSHPLVRRTVYDGLSLPRRRGAHLHAARAIESVHTADVERYVAVIANHYALAAADAAKTLEYSRRAAAAALATFAWHEAALFYQRALAASEVTPCTEAERCDLLIGLIAASVPTGQCDLVLQTAAPLAFSLAEALRDRARAGTIARAAVDALSRLGGASGLTTPEGSLWIERASAYTDEGTPERIVVDQRVLSRRGAMGIQVWDGYLAVYKSAREQGNREALFHAAFGALNGPPGPPRSLGRTRSVLEEVAGEPRTGVSPRTLALFYARAADCCLLFSDREGFERMSAEAQKLASEVMDSNGSGSSVLLQLVSCLLDGDFTGGVQLLGHADLTSAFNVLPSTVHGARTSLWLGRTVPEGIADQIPALYIRFETAKIWRPARAYLLAVSGRPEEARDLLKQWASEAQPLEDAKIWELVGALETAVLFKGRLPRSRAVRASEGARRLADWRVPGPRVSGAPSRGDGRAQ